MIVELGHYALVLALFAALVQSILPLTGAAKGNRLWMEFAAPAALAQFLAVGVSFCVLIHAYVVSDFSVLNVASNSHVDKPLIYKISGAWGNHEGSMLLWVTVMALFGASVASFGDSLPLRLKARVLGVQALIGVGFYSFILLTSNPFTRLIPAPLDGNGLNPILQDPGLAFHPPMLYLGYVGFSVTFSFAVAALLEGRVDAAWARWVRPWALAAWSFLTMGIALGSWWAYYELGWGGWWFWDPVENASFMPWLVGTALLHSAIVVEKRDALKRWTILLAILTFALSLVGTFLVRSGVLASVHAFAVDPERGLFILALLGAAIGGSLALYAFRAPTLEAGGVFAPISREGALVLNNLLLSTAAATVFIGTLYPLFMQAIDVTVTVGPPYFSLTFVPLMAPMVAAMAIGPLLSWKRGDLLGVLSRLKWIAALSALAALVVWYRATPGPVMSALGMALVVWLFLGTLFDLAERLQLGRTKLANSLARAAHLPRADWGKALAHCGLAVSILGMVGSLWRVEDIRAIKPGESFDIAAYHLTFVGVSPVQGPNYAADRADVEVRRGDALVATLTPQKRHFTVPPMTTTETAIHTTGLSDLYLALGDKDPNGSWTLRTYYNPLVPLIWFGAVIMMLGGATSLSDRRLRIGVASRRRAPAESSARSS
jgi:cytochrome c-type biogenesis protein CcmF